MAHYSAQRFRAGDYSSTLQHAAGRLPRHGDRFSRDESYSLLLELCSQEPTVLSCFKIIESTCLSRGIDVEIRGMPPTDAFRNFMERFYLPFASSAIRYFFTLGFVPWRLRKISSGDVVPELVPLGMFTWTIDSINNRLPRGARSHGGEAAASHGSSWDHSPRDGLKPRMHREISDIHQKAAERAFQKRKSYFSDPKHVPYPLQGDVGRMNTKQDGTGEAKAKRLKGFADASKPVGSMSTADPRDSNENDKDQGKEESGKSKSRNIPQFTAAYHRQQTALQRQQRHFRAGIPDDDDDSKILRYNIHFTENCNLIEDDIEIYEYLPPSNSIARSSVLYGTVPSPLSHILVDYRNIRLTQIRLAHADAFNLQAKLICSYAPPKNIYGMNEGNPIVNNPEAWAPQQRMGMFSDTNLPTEVEANAFARDAVAENLITAKGGVEHRPVVYTLPKNTGLENQPKLESIVDLPGMQGKFIRDVACLMGVPYEMVAGGYSDNSVGKAKSMHNTKTFVTNMLSICRHIELLLADVYLSAYGGTYEDVKFIIRPTPRIEVNTVEEIVQLLDAGVVSFDNAMHLSNMILGIDLKQGMGVEASAGQFSRAYITPSNKKDMIAAEAKKSAPAGSSKK